MENRSGGTQDHRVDTAFDGTAQAAERRVEKGEAPGRPTVTNLCSTVEERRFQRRVKRSWRSWALAPVALHPAETLNSPTKTDTLPHPSPTAPEPDSCGHIRDASQNPPHHESDDS